MNQAANAVSVMLNHDQKLLEETYSTLTEETPSSSRRAKLNDAETIADVIRAYIDREDIPEMVSEITAFISEKVREEDYVSYGLEAEAEPIFIVAKAASIIEDMK